VDLALPREALTAVMANDGEAIAKTKNTKQFSILNSKQR
jgi:hypothetical protein